MAKRQKNRQHNDQKDRRTDNTMAKKTEEQTTQWPKRQKNKQHNGQKDRRTDNTMTKKTEEQTTQ